MTHRNQLKNIGKEMLAVATLCVFAVLVFSLIDPKNAESEGTSGAITGYAWSDTIGWVSFSGSNYGIAIDTNGKLSGYAWSDNIGWITANESELSDCPSNPCRAKLQGGQLNGWLKAIAGDDSQSGGWDGFISLSGSGYGVSESGGTLSGFTWGDDVVGWLEFTDVSTTYQACALTQGYFCDGSVSKHRDSQCVVTTEATCGYLCAQDTGLCVPAPSPSGYIRVAPQIVNPGKTVRVTWNIDDAVSCGVTEDNSLISDSWTGTSGNEESSPITEETTYTVACDGLENTTFSATVTVSFNPSWREN